ncbi:hypothetical protein BJX70DRAFT_380188 [Aspergillus crustosus]
MGLSRLSAVKLVCQVDGLPASLGSTYNLQCFMMVIHCDIQPTNLLLDEGLHIKLSDFQGKQLSGDGKVLLDGLSGEPIRF